MSVFVVAVLLSLLVALATRPLGTLLMLLRVALFLLAGGTLLGYLMLRGDSSADGAGEVLLVSGASFAAWLATFVAPALVGRRARR